MIFLMPAMGYMTIIWGDDYLGPGRRPGGERAASCQGHHVSAAKADRETSQADSMIQFQAIVNLQ
jgi:hypothetical protein